jgi:hypothetical protein
MKKLFSFVLILVMLTLVTVSCTPTESPDPVSSDAQSIVGNTLLGQGPSDVEQTATQTPTTAAPTTEAEIDLSERIAKLTKEDGTGDVYFGQPAAEIMKILDEKDIPYEVYYWPEPDEDRISHIDLANGTSYLLEPGYLTYMDVKQTYQGIKIGDPASKVEQIYGEMDPKDFNGGIYYYVQSPIGEKVMEVVIGVDGHDSTSVVNHIEMRPQGYR